VVRQELINNLYFEQVTMIFQLICSIFTFAAISNSEFNSSIAGPEEDDCLKCVNNHSMAYFKTIVAGFDYPLYGCYSSPSLVSKYSLIVGVFCSSDDCQGFEDYPIERVYSRDESHCPLQIQKQVEDFNLTFSPSQDNGCKADTFILFIMGFNFISCTMITYLIYILKIINKPPTRLQNNKVSCLYHGTLSNVEDCH